MCKVSKSQKVGREGAVAETKKAKSDGHRAISQGHVREAPSPILCHHLLPSPNTIENSSKAKCPRSSTRNKVSKRPGIESTIKNPNSPMRSNSALLLFINKNARRPLHITQKLPSTISDVYLLSSSRILCGGRRALTSPSRRRRTGPIPARDGCLQGREVRLYQG